MIRRAILLFVGLGVAAAIAACGLSSPTVGGDMNHAVGVATGNVVDMNGTQFQTGPECAAKQSDRREPEATVTVMRCEGNLVGGGEVVGESVGGGIDHLDEAKFTVTINDDEVYSGTVADVLAEANAVPTATPTPGTAPASPAPATTVPAVSPVQTP